MQYLRIRNWEWHFETARTARLRTLTFICVPTKHDGDGYAELLDHPEGAAHYGAWICLLAVAAKSPKRGDLIRDQGVPHDAQSLSRKTRIPASVFIDAIPRLLQIGWLEEVRETGQELPETVHAGTDFARAGLAPGKSCPELSTSGQTLPEVVHVGANSAPDCPRSDTFCPEMDSAGQNLPLKGREGKGTEGNGREETQGAKPPDTPGTLSDLTSYEIEFTADFSELIPDGARAPSTRKRTKSTPREPPPEIPPTLDTSEFRHAWEEWLTARRSRSKPVSPVGAKQQLADLARYGPRVAVEAIRMSIRNDWIGLFPERIASEQHGNGTRKTQGINWAPGATHAGETNTAVDGEL